jgi:transcriptional regulator with XRE-family HTH domain
MSRIRKHAPANAVRNAFPRRLRELRRRYGQAKGASVSQATFAKLLGIDPERYGSYERGGREPNLTILASLRRVTGASLDQLICGEDDVPVSF